MHIVWPGPKYYNFVNLLKTFMCFWPSNSAIFCVSFPTVIIRPSHRGSWQLSYWVAWKWFRGSQPWLDNQQLMAQSHKQSYVHLQSTMSKRTQFSCFCRWFQQGFFCFPSLSHSLCCCYLGMFPDIYNLVHDMCWTSWDLKEGGGGEWHGLEHFYLWQHLSNVLCLHERKHSFNYSLETQIKHSCQHTFCPFKHLPVAVVYRQLKS